MSSLRRGLPGSELATVVSQLLSLSIASGEFSVVWSCVPAISGEVTGTTAAEAELFTRVSRPFSIVHLFKGDQMALKLASMTRMASKFMGLGPPMLECGSIGARVEVCVEGEDACRLDLILSSQEDIVDAFRSLDRFLPCGRVRDLDLQLGLRDETVDKVLSCTANSRKRLMYTDISLTDVCRNSLSSRRIDRSWSEGLNSFEKAVLYVAHGVVSSIPER